MALRPYQLEAVESVLDSYRAGKRAPIIVCATGGGKTHIAAHIIDRLTAKGKHAILLAHRSELIDQAFRKLQDCGITPGVIKATDSRKNMQANVQVASVQTLVNRIKPGDVTLYKWRPLADLIIIDEAHHFSAGGSYDKIIKEYPGAKLIGLTATPERTDGRGLGDLFDDLILVSSPAQLMEEGFLCPYEIYESPMHLDFSGVKKVMGELNEKEVSIIVDKPKVIGNVYETWRRHADGRPTLVFARNRQHGEHLRDVFVEGGVKCEYVDDRTKTAERQAIIKRYMDRKTTVLVNIGLFTEGTDLPLTECVQMTWPTLSLIKYLQMLGRGLRPSPGKGLLTVLDHGGNVHLHGLPDDPREWSLEGRKKRPQAKVAALTTCPKCFAIFRARTRNCPRCGFQVIASGDPIPEFIDVQLVKREIIPRKVLAAQKEDEAAIQRAFFANLMQGAVGHKPKWALVEYKKRFSKWPGEKHGVKIDWVSGAGGYEVKQWYYKGVPMIPAAVKKEDFSDEELFAF